MRLVQEFDFRAHDSAFKDRYMQLQNVRVRFLPTDKKDIHDMGPMEEVKDSKSFSASFPFRRLLNGLDLLLRTFNR